MCPLDGLKLVFHIHQIPKNSIPSNKYNQIMSTKKSNGLEIVLIPLFIRNWCYRLLVATACAARSVAVITCWRKWMSGCVVGADLNIDRSIDHDAASLLLQNDAAVLLPQLLFRIGVLQSVLVNSDLLVVVLHRYMVCAINSISQIVVFCLSASCAIADVLRLCSAAAVLRLQP